MPQEIIAKITKIFKKNFNNKPVKINNDFISNSDYDIELLVFCVGYLKYNDLNDIKKILELKANNFLGLIVFNKEMFEK